MDSPIRRSRRLAGLPPSDDECPVGDFITPDRYPNGIRRQPTGCTNFAGLVASALGTLMFLRVVTAVFVPL